MINAFEKIHNAGFVRMWDRWPVLFSGSARVFGFMLLHFYQRPHLHHILFHGSFEGVRPQLRIALVAMLKFCLIIRKCDHQTFFHSNCHHLIDILTKFYQNHKPPALLERPDVRCL